LNDIAIENMKLYVAPPHNPELLTRAQAPEKPGFFGSLAVKALKVSLENVFTNDENLPWAPRERLCPSKDFDSNFKMLEEACADMSNPSANCIYRFSNVYPCFNYYLRSSKKFSHGMSGLTEFMTINHIVKEAPWNFIKALAQEKPWDEELEEAIKILGLEKPKE